MPHRPPTTDVLTATFGAAAPGLTNLPQLAPALALGRLLATPAAIDYLQRHGVPPGALLARHLFGDPGELGAEDHAANAYARAHGERVLSAYANGPAREVVWVITEADRSATTLLLPSDY